LAVVFLLGVGAVVFFGIFPGLRPDVASGVARLIRAAG